MLISMPCHFLLAVISSLGPVSSAVSSPSTNSAPSSALPATPRTVPVGVAATEQSAEKGGPYLRLVEREDGRFLELEVAICTLTPDEEGAPEIMLAAAVHIAEPSFYSELQGALDSRDLVLFESVRPAGTGRAMYDKEGDSDESKVRISRDRLRFLAVLLDGYFDRNNAYPADLDQLAAGIKPEEVELLKIARVDGFGTPVVFSLGSNSRRGKFDLISLGSDQTDGGSGAAADLFFSDQDPLKAAELGKDFGIQQDLATAMGLVFQLDAMSHSGHQWRNSDLAVDQIQARLGVDLNAEKEELFSLLSGESLLAEISGSVLRFVGKSKIGKAAMMLVGIEVLSRADQLLQNAPDELASLMGVLLRDRNRVVLDDVRTAIEAGEVSNIGIVYGAAHMTDLERRLRMTQGYEVSAKTWNRAVTLDLDGLPISRTQINWFRSQIQSALELELGGD